MKWLSFITVGWTPILLGSYLTYKEDYFSAVICFLISFCGFRQVYDDIKVQEELDKIHKLLKDKNV